MEEQALIGVGIAPPEPKLTAAAVAALVAQVAALLKSLDFRVLGWGARPDALPPAGTPCQDIWASWQGPTTRFEVSFTGYPELGWADFSLQAWLRGFQANTSRFFVHSLADVQFLLDNWQPLHGERAQAARGELGLIAVLREPLPEAGPTEPALPPAPTARAEEPATATGRAEAPGEGQE